MSGPAGRLDVVLVCGGRWHDFDTARLELLARLARREHVRTRVFEDYAQTAALDSADLLISYTCDVRPDEAQQAALAAYVGSGGRWLALHGTNSAIDPPTPGAPKLYRTPRVLGEVPRVLGSQFLGHPKIAPYTVEVTEPSHPLVQGISAFEVTDELYVSELHGELDVLLHTSFVGPSPGFEESAAGEDPAGERRPVLYLHRYGAGEVCYLTLGHCRGRFDMQDRGIDDLGVIDRGSWDTPEYTTVLDRCIDWCLTPAGVAR